MNTIVRAMASGIVAEMLPSMLRNVLTTSKGSSASRSSSPRLAHQLPGRIRFYYPQLKENNAAALSIANTLFIVEGITAVRVDHRTGGILIKYDDSLIHPDQLATAISRLLEEEENSSEAGEKSGGNTLATLMSALNQQLGRLSPWQIITGLLFLLLLLGPRRR